MLIDHYLLNYMIIVSCYIQVFPFLQSVKRCIFGGGDGGFSLCGVES